MSTFKEEHRELQEICRELRLVREHNLKFKKDDPQDTMLHFAEGLLVLLALERFLRIILGPDANIATGSPQKGRRRKGAKGGAGKKPRPDTLPNLLEKATSESRNLLTLPGDLDTRAIDQAITSVRNTLMHADYEQAVAAIGHADVPAYFKSGNYISEVETLFLLLDELMKQIDVNTGKPHGARA